MGEESVPDLGVEGWEGGDLGIIRGLPYSIQPNPLSPSSLSPSLFPSPSILSLTSVHAGRFHHGQPVLYKALKRLALLGVWYLYLHGFRGCSSPLTDIDIEIEIEASRRR